MRLARFITIDYGVLSSYLSKSATVIVFSAIVLLAIGALYLESDDMAHMPILIGVCAFDSARVTPALESLADFYREKGCGDIKWRYFAEHERASGCDFYFMTSLQLSPSLARGELGCALIAAEREARRYSVGAVIVRSGVRLLPPGGGRIIFSSPVSAAGFRGPATRLPPMGTRSISPDVPPTTSVCSSACSMARTTRGVFPRNGSERSRRRDRSTAVKSMFSSKGRRFRRSCSPPIPPPIRPHGGNSFGNVQRFME